MTVYRFEPPTHEEPMRTDTPPLRYFRLTWANTIIKISGVYTAVRSPSGDQLKAAGIEGTDYFRGGYVYFVNQTVRDSLVAAGYTLTGPFGYGVGLYGIGRYGE